MERGDEVDPLSFIREVLMANGFDIDRLADPTLPENLEKVSGRGIFIAKSMVDGFSYDQNEKGSVFTILVNK